MLPEAVQSIGSIWLSASNMIMELIFNAFIQGKAGLVKGKAKRQYTPDTREISVMAEIYLYTF